MADLKISDMTDGGLTEAGDEFPALRAGENVRVVLGTAAALDTGTEVGDVVILQDLGGGNPQYPAADGSLLTGLTAGVASTITVANEASDTSSFLTFVTSATGNLEAKTNSNLAFNASTGLLTLGLLSASYVNVSGTTAPANGMFLPAANTMGFSINSTEEWRMTSSGFFPAATNGSSIGSSTRLVLKG